MEADSDDEDEKGAFDTGDLEGEFSRAGVNHRDQDAGCVHDRPWEEDRMSSVSFLLPRVGFVTTMKKLRKT